MYRRNLTLLLTFLPILIAGAYSQNPQTAATPAARAPHAKVIELDAKGAKELPILRGTPDSYRMRAGLIVLAPGQTVGQHSTKNNEELLVVLEGRGEMLFEDHSKLTIHGGAALYCPPETTHDVRNTGTRTLRYVYVVSQAKDF